MRYRRDFRAFAREQLRLGGRPFEFWPCQIPVLDVVDRQMADRGFVRLVVLKARQTGMSTLVQALVAWRTMLWPNTNAIVIADQAERAKTLFDISKSFYEQMDDDSGVKPMGRYITKRELVFANPSSVSNKRDPGLRSRIVVDSAHKKNIAIGANWHIAHLSECARFPDHRFVLDGIVPAVHRVPGTMLVMETSAEMSGVWFRDFFDGSVRGETGFEAVFVPWFLQPEYIICPVCKRGYDAFAHQNLCTDPVGHELDALTHIDLTADERHVMAEFNLKPGHIQWLREKLMEMGNDWDLFRQSYPLTADDAWVTAGAEAFSVKHLRMQRENIMPPIRTAELYPGPAVLDDMRGKLSIWEEPQMGKAYDIGVDVAQGIGKDEDAVEDGRDYSVACVLERGTNRQVAEWSSKAIDPFELATHMYWLGKFYNDAQVAIEVNNIGGGTNNQLSKMGYPNLYLWRYRDEAMPRYSKKTGWETSPKSKAWLVGFTGHELINQRFVLRSEKLYREFATYVRTGPKEWGAVAGYHDDRVQAFMIALIASDDENFEKYYGLNRLVPKDKALVVSPEPWQADLTFKRAKIEKDTDPWD